MKVTLQVEPRAIMFGQIIARGRGDVKHFGIAGRRGNYFPLLLPNSVVR
jgi:hypothetical protein